MIQGYDMRNKWFLNESFVAINQSLKMLKSCIERERERGRKKELKTNNQNCTEKYSYYNGDKKYHWMSSTRHNKVYIMLKKWLKNK